jgi:hypothetical protein
LKVTIICTSGHRVGRAESHTREPLRVTLKKRI